MVKLKNSAGVYVWANPAQVALVFQKPLEVLESTLIFANGMAEKFNYSGQHLSDLLDGKETLED
jgi:hypothetical protein